MKILIIQLTRLGDILCTLPTLSSLKRDNPFADIHLLVRKSFSEAATLSGNVDHIWQLDSEKLLKPLIEHDCDFKESLSQLNKLIDCLRLENFDKIINLSFSPSSTYITHLISRGKITTAGFTRTSDLYLHVPDEASRYFRAQVGVDRSNRVHVVDLMAWIAGVTISNEDLRCLHTAESKREKRGIVIHLGASQKSKTWPVEYWIDLIRSLRSESINKITLIGGKKEFGLNERVIDEIGRDFCGPHVSTIQNLCGTLKLSELSSLLASSELFIGADSGPQHVASLSGCKVLNLSVGRVRFWETGPLSSESRVLIKLNPHYLTPGQVLCEVKSMLAKSKALLGKEAVPGSTADAFVSSLKDSVRFSVKNQICDDKWPVVRWIYFQGPRPSVDSFAKTALLQCIETCEIALSQAESFFKSPTKTEIMGILDRLDQVLGLLREKVPSISPLLEDFFCEKENIAPGSRREVFYQTDVCYRNLKVLCESLLTHNVFHEKGASLCSTIK